MRTQLNGSVRVFLTCALGAAAVLPAAAQGEAKPARPAYSFLRQNEDWSKFQGGDDFFDPYKRVSLNDDGSWWVSFGGRAEARAEVWSNFNFGAPPTANHDDEFVVSRLLMHSDFHFGQDFRLYLEGKTAQATDRDLPGGRRTLDLDTLDLQQAFVDWRFAAGDEDTVTLRPGRQMLLFGNQRLISPLPWGNTLRTWDGITGVWKHGPWSITGILTYFVPVDKTDFNEADEDEVLWGIYARRFEPGAKDGTEIYLIGNEREDVTVNGTAGDARRQTLGARRWGTMSERSEYEVEAAYQVGEVGPGDVCAGFITAELGWRPEDGAWDPRYFVVLDYATGDDGTGGDVGTFDQLYPLGHAYFGYIDTIGRQNIIAIAGGGTWKPRPHTTLRAAANAFWLADTSDALYNAGGGIVRAPGSFDSSYVGLEIDLTASRKVGQHLEVYGGYSHFFAGDALEDSGPSEDIDFFHIGTRFTF